MWCLAGIVGACLLAPAPLHADLVEKVRNGDSSRGSDGGGTVYEHDTSRYSDSRRNRRNRNPVVPSGDSVYRVAPISQFETDSSAAPAPAEISRKPRFGYGSDYQPGDEGGKTAPEDVPEDSSPSYRYPTPPSYEEPSSAPYAESRSPRREEGKSPRYDESRRSDDRDDVPYDPRRRLDELLPPVAPMRPRDREGASIVFDFSPPVHREYWPVIPHHHGFGHPFDRHCEPRIRLPFFFSAPRISGRFCLPIPTPFH